jgi:hypothetical protein
MYIGKNKCLKELWGDVVDCAKYLLNRFTTKYLCNIIPKEAWGLHKPNIDHLRVFGNDACAKIQEEKRTKLGKKILLRYRDNYCGYKFYNSITKKVMISTDVQFNEEKI